MVVAILGLLFAMGGTALAVDTIKTEDIVNGTILGEDVAEGTLPASKLTAEAVASLKGQTGPQGPTGVKGAPGPAGPTGIQGAPGSPGSALGFATITATGDVIEAQSSHVSDANVSRHGNVICFGGLSFAPKAAIANIDYNFGVGRVVGTSFIPTGNCPGNETASAVQLTSSGASASPVRFTIAFY